MSTTTPPDGPLLIEVITTRPQASPVGFRVYADGRYDYLSDTQIVIAPDGGASASPVPLAWRTVTTFSAAQLAQLQQTIRAADVASLPARSAPPGPAYDASTQTWRIWEGGAETTIVVEGYPLHALPALEALAQQINALRPLPASRSEWRVWVGGRVERRSVECDVAEVAELRPLVQALLAPAALPPVAPADLPDLPPDEPIVEVRWQQQGSPDETTAAYADGRVVSVVGGRETLVRTLDTAQLAALLAAAAGVDWAALPDPVCA